MKSAKDLEINISNYDNFCKFLIEYKLIIETGKLAEYYCNKLFDIELSLKSNEMFDGTDKDNKKVEIKHRMFTGKVPPGMKIDLKNSDYILYVELFDNLLPKNIWKIDNKLLNVSNNGRVLFSDVFKNNKAIKVFNYQ